MRNRNLLVIVALSCLVALAGIGAWLLMDTGPARVAERPTIPHVGR